MSNQKFRLSVMSLWVGILIPIIAAVIPYIVKSFLPETRLEYTITGQVSVKGTNSIGVRIQNGGERLEKNVRLAFNASDLWKLNGKDAVDSITVDTQATTKIVKEGNWVVIYLGDLRPKEFIDVSVMSDIISITAFRVIEPSGIAVKSDESLGKFNGPSEFTEFIYPFGFWMFVLLMVFVLVIAIYQQYFMDPNKREEFLLKEIDKLSQAKKQSGEGHQ
jgi:hypothetical protein